MSTFLVFITQTGGIMGKPIRVLLVEDDLVQSMGYAMALEHVNMSVERVYTVADAIATLYQESFDAVVLDINLPDMSGFTVLEAVRQKRITTPVIILSMETRPSAMRLARDLGAILYLPKPFAPAELAEKVQLITNTEPSSGSIEVQAWRRGH